MRNVLNVFRTAGIASVLVLVVVAACGGSSASPTTPSAVAEASSTTSTVGLPVAFTQFTPDVQVSLEGDVVVLRADGVPSHSSPYFATTDPRYEAYTGSNPRFFLNPNRIREQMLTLRIPAAPQEAQAHEPTPLGPIGLAVNGVAIFNQYAGPGRPLTEEIDTFDQYNGHPQQTGLYHYHVEPLYLTLTAGGRSLVGFLLDGFPVYGPEENGRRVTSGDLDQFHGHVGSTPEYPGGIYHYHITGDDPFINGAGFYGVAGTVGQ